MTSIPSAGTKPFWGANVTIAAGSYTLVGVARGRFDWGYAIESEKRVGNNMPYFGTGSFTGKGDFEVFASSDQYIATTGDIYAGTSGFNVLTAANIIPDTTFTFTMLDTASSQAKEIWTVVGKVNNVDIDVQDERIVKLTMKVTLTAVPTVTNA